MNDIIRIKSISEFHNILGLESPNHPLISLIDEKNRVPYDTLSDEIFDVSFTLDMYAIMFKDKKTGALGYGRNTYDYQEGTMVFISPDQVIKTPARADIEKSPSGDDWTLLFHPDLIHKSNLIQEMNNYSFFFYEVNEALHLSKKEQLFVYEIVNQIQEEYSKNLDKHSQKLINTNLQLLLNYCIRFYDRQFITRTNHNIDYISQFEKLLKNYYSDNETETELLTPSISYFGQKMSMSSHYLSDLLKKETGKGIKDHINDMIVSKAKTILLNSNLPINQIAYDLGFQYPQSFTRMFKNRTGINPKEYRLSS